MAPEGDLWIFAYGSLMWRPGFAALERRPALLHGHRRRLCILSEHYRGTKERPGLVLGLDAGGACRGVAYRVARDLKEATLAAVRAREMLGGVYREDWPQVELDDARIVLALSYFAQPLHPRYASEMPPETVLSLVRQGCGAMGTNADYVLNTHDHLAAMGVFDPELGWLAQRLRAE